MALISRTPCEVRCSNGLPCCEVVDRLRAADRSEREGQQQVADELRKTAARWAMVHNYGQGPPEVAA